MCGICGIAGPGKESGTINRMNDILAHRGPDGAGVWEGEKVALGHRRLAIIDLETGHQPMSNSEKSLWIVFNGEIYNFKVLRKNLQDCGHFFQTVSDTEVLLHGYEEYGLGFISKLDGIFAFALWDVKQQRLVLARDYFGVKPLHYQIDGKTIRFASEIKAILQDHKVEREPDFQSIHSFLNLRYVPGQGTLFKNIHSLAPAHYLIFENSRVDIKKYFTLQADDLGRHDESFYMEGIQEYLSCAIKKQMISDVPIGAYLSGGLDSSSIVSFMSQLSDSPVKSFSMGFNEPTDELHDAKIVAEHFATDHHEINVSPEPLRSFPEVIWHAEEPKENILQGFLLSKFASQHVKVVLGGLGGDEIFTGYGLHKYFYPSRHIHKFVPGIVKQKILRPSSNFLFNAQNLSGKIKWDEYRRGLQLIASLGDPARYYCILRNVWDEDPGMAKNIYGPLFLQQILKKNIVHFEPFFKSTNQTPFDQMLFAEFHTKLAEDFLMNEDRTSMANGLEVRVPFLDIDLVRFVLGIPEEIKMKHNQTKFLFRRAMADHLPEHTLHKKKWGFSFNPFYQFQKDLKQTAQKILTKKRVTERGWFNYSYLKTIMDHPPHPRLRWHYFFLWLVMGLEIWYQLFIEEDPSNPNFNIEHYYK